MDHKKRFQYKRKGIFRSSEYAACERLGKGFQLFSREKLKRGIIIVFRYVKATIKRKAVCSLYILQAEAEKWA